MSNKLLDATIVLGGLMSAVGGIMLQLTLGEGAIIIKSAVVMKIGIILAAVGVLLLGGGLIVEQHMRYR